MSDKQYFTMIQVRNALNQIADRMAEDQWKPNVIVEDVFLEFILVIN